jgi:hypothetical protein
MPEVFRPLPGRVLDETGIWVAGAAQRRIVERTGESADQAHRIMAPEPEERDAVNAMRQVGRDEIGIGHHVAVQEEQQASRGGADPEIACRRRALVLLGAAEVVVLDWQPVAVGHHQLPGLSRSGVVDHDHLRRRDRLPAQALQHPLEPQVVVTGGQDHRER